MVTGYGFLPGEKVTLELFSKTFVLGEAQADSTGSISQTVTIPREATAGEHTIFAIGQTSSLHLSTTVTLLSKQKPAGTGSIVNQQARMLANTGASSAPIDGLWVTVPLALLAGGYAARRKRTDA